MLCIIKADDLVLGAFRTEWEQFFALIREQGAAASTGVIGKPSEVACARDASLGQWLRPYVADDRFEFWNHGYSHTHGEFFAPLEQQIESIRRTDRLLREVLEVQSKVFGPPFNRYGPALFEACAASGMEVLYHGVTDLVPLCMPPKSFLSCELKDTGNDPDGASFKRSFERLRTDGASFFVLQVHPWRWSTGPHGGFSQFRSILEYLKAAGVQFTTAEGLRALHRHDAQLAGPELAQRISARALAFIEKAGASNPRLRHEFFASRYRRGLEEWSAKIEALGFTERIAGAPLSALDIGCGVGQWATAFALCNPNSTVVAVDPAADFLGVLSNAIADTPLKTRVRVVEARAEDYVHQREPADVVLNNGVLMYAEHERLIKNISGASKLGSRQYISYHTDQHYFRKIVDAFEIDGDRNAMRRWARVHASISLYNVGLGSTWTREWCLPRERLVALYRIAGFEVLARPEVWDAEDRIYDGSETFVEYVFEKKSDFAPAVRRFVDGHDSLPAALGAMVAAGLPGAALDVIESAGGYRARPDLETPFLLASTKARELIPVFEMDLDGGGVEPFALALYLFEIGHTRRALGILREIAGPESIFLQCIGLRQSRRVTEAHELALAQCRAHPGEALYWCALFYTASVHPEAAPLPQAIDCWRQAHPRDAG